MNSILMLKRISICILLGSALAGCSHMGVEAGEPTSLNLHLQWRPTDDPRDMPAAGIAALTGQQLQVVMAADGRIQPPNKVGQNNQDPQVRPVTTSDDVDAFVAQNIAQVLQANGIQVVPQGATRVLQLKLMNFYVTEANTYETNVSLGVTLDDGGRKVLWQGSALGKANRWGRSFEAENYQEALSNAVMDAVKNLLANPAFVAAASAH